MNFTEQTKRLLQLTINLSQKKDLSQDLRNMMRSNADNIHLISELIENRYKTLPTRMSEKKFSELGKEADFFMNEIHILAMYFSSFYFFVRSFQDNLLRAYFEITGQNWGLGTSMIKRKKVNQDFLSVLADKEEYEDWFGKMRELRNNMKYGLHSSGGGLDKDSKIDVTFLAIQKDGKRVKRYPREVYLSELEEAIIRSSSAIQALLNLEKSKRI